MIRLFICIELSENVRSRIASQLVSLRSIGTGIRWVDERNLHITLKFLGDVPKDEVDNVVKSVELSAKNSKEFLISFVDIGAFPNMANPSTFWIGVERGALKLGVLVSDIDSVLSREGFPPDKRSFVPHLTIGRAKLLHSNDELRGVLDKMKQVHFADMRVDTITVMESKLYKDGPVYTPLKRIFIRS